MKKFVSIFALIAILLNGPTGIKKADAVAIAGGNIPLGIGIATGLFFAVGGIAAMNISTQKDMTPAGKAILMTSGVALILIGFAVILLPADENTVEFNQVSLDNLPNNLSIEDAETFNYWAIPLSLRSRSIGEKVAAIIEEAQNSELYDTQEEIAELTKNIWKEEFTKLGISEEEITSIKNVLSAKAN